MRILLHFQRLVMQQRIHLAEFASFVGIFNENKMKYKDSASSEFERIVISERKAAPSWPCRCVHPSVRGSRQDIYD